MDRFSDMRTFVTVVEAGTISAAAERLGVAKSAVSRRLAELEERLGVQLFRRTTRRLNLTDSGRSFYERCVQILADLAEAELAVADEHGELRGRLRVALPLSFGLRHMGPAISAFAAEHPGVEFDLDFNDREVDLLQEGFDVAIRIGVLPDSSLIARRLAPIDQAVYASVAYLEEHGSPRRPAELVGHQALVYSNLPDPATWRYREPDGRKGVVKVPVRLAANNGDFLCQAAAAGCGLSLLPTFITYDAVAAGRLVPVLPDYHWRTVNAYALYPQTRHLSARVRTFVEFLIRRFAGVPYWDRPPAPQ